LEYHRLVRWRLTLAGVPLQLDWTLLLGPLLLSGFRFAPLEWLLVLGLLGLHALGHLAAAWLVGGRVTRLELTGFGGTCECSGYRSSLGQAFVAWGGLIAQAAVLAAATLAPTGWPAPLLEVATQSNAWLFAVNLVPSGPLDGAEAWKLPWLLGRRLRARVRGRRGVVYEVEAARKLSPDDPHHAEARALAAQLIEDARRDETP